MPLLLAWGELCRCTPGQIQAARERIPALTPQCQEDFKHGVSELLLPVSPASAKHACLSSTEESLDVLVGQTFG